MAGSLNKVTLVGRLGQDPKIAYTSTGRAVANFSLATDEGYKDRQTGQKVDKTEWHRIVVWGQQAEFCSNYLTKGRLALVEGRLQTRKWQGQDGSDRFTTEIVCDNVQILDRGNNEGSFGGQQDSQMPQDSYAPQQNSQQNSQQNPQQNHQQDFLKYFLVCHIVQFHLYS